MEMVKWNREQKKKLAAETPGAGFIDDVVGSEAGGAGGATAAKWPSVALPDGVSPPDEDDSME